MIKAVVFDLDDTLISEMDYIKSGFNIIAHKIYSDYKVSTPQEIYSMLLKEFTVNHAKIFNRTLERLEIQPAQNYISDLVHAYRNHKPNIEFLEDVLPTLIELKRRSIKIGIISDGYKETQHAKLETLNAYELFDHIIVTDDLGRDFWKPNPHAFEMMKEKFNVEFNEMIYIGDNPEKDFYIGSIYQIRTIRIKRGGSIHCEKAYLDQIKEKYSVSKIYQILEYLETE